MWTGVDRGEMEDGGGSETGCGRVWRGVRMEDGGEGRWRVARRGVDGGEDGRWGGARRGVDGCVDGGEDGRWRGARRGVDGCGRG